LQRAALSLAVPAGEPGLKIKVEMLARQRAPAMLMNAIGLQGAGVIAAVTLVPAVSYSLPLGQPSISLNHVPASMFQPDRNPLCEEPIGEPP